MNFSFFTIAALSIVLALGLQTAAAPGPGVMGGGWSGWRESVFEGGLSNGIWSIQLTWVNRLIDQMTLPDPKMVPCSVRGNNRPLKWGKLLIRVVCVEIQTVKHYSDHKYAANWIRYINPGVVTRRCRGTAAQLQRIAATNLELKKNPICMHETRGEYLFHSSVITWNLHGTAAVVAAFSPGPFRMIIIQPTLR
ncbi:hypothetical protein B0H13DRAFT_1878640 [Mycena leptocephala]|nr:hypothetical protein B0H13DRAFT_1878640 [Mycena leptocephala]